MNAEISRDTSNDGPAADKYSRERLLSPKKLRKGVTRWNQFATRLAEIDPESLQGPILDFGSGVGYFVLEGLKREMDIWGVDFLPGKVQRYGKLIGYTSQQESWKTRCLVGDGYHLPFASGTFSAISSWFVFEHIPEPEPVVTELVRVLRPHGVIVIRAEDARSRWEGHCKIPWEPFLADHLTRVWMEEFDCAPEMREEVYDLTQPQCEAILKGLNCRIISTAPNPPQPVAQIDLSSERKVRERARQIKALFERGAWVPQPAELYIYAQKL